MGQAGGFVKNEHYYHLASQAKGSFPTMGIRVYIRSLFLANILRGSSLNKGNRDKNQLKSKLVFEKRRRLDSDDATFCITKDGWQQGATPPCSVILAPASSCHCDCVMMMLCHLFKPESCHLGFEAAKPTAGSRFLINSERLVIKPRSLCSHYSSILTKNKISKAKT